MARGQRGFSLLEIVLALAVAGLIVPPISMALLQITRAPERINSEFQVQDDLDRASNWFSEDLSLAQTTDLVDGAGPVNSMRVDWVDQTGWSTPGAESHYVQYSLSGSNFQRDYDGTVNIIARYVTAVQFSRNGRFITINITSTLEDKTQNLTYHVTARADGAFN